MKYIIQDMETMSVHTVEESDMRRFLNDQIPQGTETVYELIDFASDYFEGKNNYSTLAFDAIAKLGFRISREEEVSTPKLIIKENLMPTSERTWFPWVKDQYLCKLGIPQTTNELLFSVFVNIELPLQTLKWEDIVDAMLYSYTGIKDWKKLPNEDTKDFAYLKIEVEDRIKNCKYVEIDDEY